MTSPRKPSSNFDFGRNLAELEAIVHQLEDGDIALDRAIAQYEKGAQIAAELQQYLDSAQLKINHIKASFAVADTGPSAANDEAPANESELESDEQL